MNKQFDLTEELNEKLQDFLVNFKRETTEEVLMDILLTLYFLDCNRECEYSKMSASDIVKIYHETLGQIEKRYNFDFNRELGF